MTVRKKSPVDFERRLQQLEAIVEALEEGGQSLEEALKSFEQGIKITRECQQALTSAEQRVELLTRGLAGDLDTTVLAAMDVAGDDDSE